MAKSAAKGQKGSVATLERSDLAAQEQSSQALILGEFAHQVLAEQYRHVVKREKSVLADKNPEHLHQMRVGGRRLYTALQVFESVVQLPKAAQPKRVRSFIKVLGKLRDLDVQTAALEEEYRPQLSSKSERHQLDDAIAHLHKERRQALAKTQETLTDSDYQNLKEAFESWLDKPRYTMLAEMTVRSLLPDLLSPLLSMFLLHPGWLIGTDDMTEENVPVLHDLRKACKHVRYQTDFFLPFYGESFKTWVQEVKQLQESLGKLHDAQVLREFLKDVVGKRNVLPQVEEQLHQQERTAMQGWDEVRDRYLSADYRFQLHRLLTEVS